MSTKIRLFIAVELPEGVKTSLVTAPGLTEVWRRLERDAIHLTLAFLGYRTEEQCDGVRGVMEEIAVTTFQLQLADVTLLPPKRPRVLSVAVKEGDGELARYQAELVERLHQAELFEPEKRPFFPHVTIARLRHGVKPPLSVTTQVRPVEFSASTVTLYRSDLHPSGTKYTPLFSLRA